MARYTKTSLGSNYASKQQIDSNLDDIATAITDTLSRKGDSPNNMEADLDMDSNQILNLPDAVTPSEPVTLRQFNAQSVGTKTTQTLKQKHTATAGQTLFVTPQYVIGSNNLSIYINGVRQEATAYSETTTTSVTLSEGVEVGDIVEVLVNELQESTDQVGAANVTYDGSTVAVHLDALTFDTVADMVASSGLQIGMKVKTWGYTSVGDGGGSEYRIVAAGTGTDDGGSFIDLATHQANLIAGGHINVKQFGAAGDNTSDDTSALQAAYDYAADVSNKPTGGRQVYHPKGIYRTSGKLQVESDVKLIGDSWTTTYIKPLDSATFAANEAVVQSKDFETVQGTDLWDYYSPYPNGLIMGFEIRNMTIDGNRANVANAGGLHIYGGKWLFEDIGVINTVGHGVWTEAGIPGSSTSGDDLHDFLNMHESSGKNVYISNSNKHGWYYRGPNDSNIDNIQIKASAWGGFFQESTGNNSVGNLEIGSIHAYSCACGHDANGAQITLANSNSKFIYTDASAKHGLIFNTSANVASYILVLKNNTNNAGAFYGVKVDSVAQIGFIRNSDQERTSGTDGGVLQVNAETYVDQLRTSQVSATSIAQKGIDINADCTIASAVIENYDSTGSVGVDVSSSRVDVNVAAKNCLTAIDYNTAGRNNIKLNALTCTTDINFATAKAENDIVIIESDNQTLSTIDYGRSLVKSENLRKIDTGYSASITPNMNSGSYVKVGTLTGNITVNNPTNVTNGDILTVQFQQDGTGGHAVTWGANFKTGYSDTGNAAFTRHLIEFIYDGTFFVERSKSGWY